MTSRRAVAKGAPDRPGVGVTIFKYSWEKQYPHRSERMGRISMVKATKDQKDDFKWKNDYYKGPTKVSILNDENNEQCSLETIQE